MRRPATRMWYVWSAQTTLETGSMKTSTLTVSPLTPEMNQRRWVEYADYGKWFITPKSISPGWQGWLAYMYDDPPNDKHFVNPDYRPKRTYYLKLDHPTQAYKNPNHF